MLGRWAESVALTNVKLPERTHTIVAPPFRSDGSGADAQGEDFKAATAFWPNSVTSWVR